MNKSQKLISDSGIYDIDADQAIFKGRVIVKDSFSLLQTDSLKYDLSREIVYIIAPTFIKTDSSEIYCEGGYFDYKKNEGLFYNNLEIKNGERIIIADKVRYIGPEKKYILTGYPVVNERDRQARANTIIYYEEKEILDLLGQAFYKDDKRNLKSDIIKYNLKTDQYETSGDSEVIDNTGRTLKAELLFREPNGVDVAERNVVLKDINQNITLYGDVLKSDSKSDNYLAFNHTDQPLLVKELKDDTFFLKCDTLVYSKTDSTEFYLGKEKVSFLKSDISGRSGNLTYSALDSQYVFTNAPIFWSDSIQITGDTILIIMQNNQIEAMKVIGNAFMIMQSAEGTFNQVKGDIITCNFQGENLDEIEVEKNVEMVYFIYEDHEIIGVNHTLCGGLNFTFTNDNIDYLRFKDKPKSNFSKGVIIDAKSHNLQGFNWSESDKPRKKSFSK